MGRWNLSVVKWYFRVLVFNVIDVLFEVRLFEVVDKC